MNNKCMRCFKEITPEEKEHIEIKLNLRLKDENWKLCGSINWFENLCPQCNDDLYNILTIFFSGDKILPMEEISKLINLAIYEFQLKFDKNENE